MQSSDLEQVTEPSDERRGKKDPRDVVRHTRGGKSKAKTRSIRNGPKHHRKFDSTYGFPGEGPEFVRCVRARPCIRSHFHRRRAFEGAQRRVAEALRDPLTPPPPPSFSPCIEVVCVLPRHYHQVDEKTTPSLTSVSDFPHMPVANRSNEVSRERTSVPMPQQSPSVVVGETPTSALRRRETVGYDADPCAVCITAITRDEHKREVDIQLPCSHWFHRVCICTTISFIPYGRALLCPICRVAVSLAMTNALAVGVRRPPLEESSGDDDDFEQLQDFRREDRSSLDSDSSEDDDDGRRDAEVVRISEAPDWFRVPSNQSIAGNIIDSLSEYMIQTACFPLQRSVDEWTSRLVQWAAERRVSVSAPGEVYHYLYNDMLIRRRERFPDEFLVPPITQAVAQTHVESHEESKVGEGVVSANVSSPTLAERRSRLLAVQEHEQQLRRMARVGGNIAPTIVPYVMAAAIPEAPSAPVLRPNISASGAVKPVLFVEIEAERVRDSNPVVLTSVPVSVLRRRREERKEHEHKYDSPSSSSPSSSTSSDSGSNSDDSIGKDECCSLIKRGSLVDFMPEPFEEKFFGPEPIAGATRDVVGATEHVVIYYNIEGATTSIRRGVSHWLLGKIYRIVPFLHPVKVPVLNTEQGLIVEEKFNIVDSRPGGFRFGFKNTPPIMQRHRAFGFQDSRDEVQLIEGVWDSSESVTVFSGMMEVLFHSDMEITRRNAVAADGSFVDSFFKAVLYQAQRHHLYNLWFARNPRWTINTVIFVAQQFFISHKRVHASTPKTNKVVPAFRSTGRV